MQAKPADPVIKVFVATCACRLADAFANAMLRYAWIYIAHASRVERSGY